MKRLLALLLLVITPVAYGQVDYTNAINTNSIIQNPGLDGCTSGGYASTTCGAWMESSGTTGDFIDGSYFFTYSQSTLFQDIDLSKYRTDAFQIFFFFSLNNDWCRNSIGGSCENPAGPLDYIKVDASVFDVDGFVNSVTFLQGNIQTNGWGQYGYFTSFENDSEFTNLRISFTGYDAGFWGGFYGPIVDNITANIRYIDKGEWTTIAGENQNFVLLTETDVRYGGLDTYTTLTLAPGEYSCSNGLFGDPIGGVVKSCQIPVEPPTTPDCTINPTDPTCIIQDLINPDSDESMMLADENSGSSDGTEVVADEEDPAPAEEMLAAADPITEELIDDSPAEESLEELLAEESVEEDELDEEVTAVAAIKEMVNEEKASALSDNISKDVLGAALSVAADAVSAATVAGSESASSSTSSDSSSRSTTLTAATSETVATTTETVAVTESASETVKEESAESSAVAALDILDTGRQLGQEALSVTLALTEAAATESLSEAESVAAVSSSDSVLASMNSIDTAAAVVIEEQQLANNETTTETVTEETATTENTEVVVAENNVEAVDQVTTEVEQKEEVKEEVMIVEVKEQETTETVKEQEEIVVAEVQQEQTSDVTVEREETIVAEVQTQQVEVATEQREEVVVAETVTETVIENTEQQVVAEVQSEQSSAIEFTTVEQAMEVFASNINQQAAAEQEELENSIVQQAVAASQTEEENKMGFAEAEAVTIASDPALANAFNIQPNTASLELLGVLSNKAEEKSDAELRAEQVVAANKEQQEAINANYMEADQSGILAAIGSETDVSAYRSAMLRDASAWYKPEDIYKGVIIKDNVRGSYFLEKGNTDTYKKMVEEQYKDE